MSIFRARWVMGSLASLLAACSGSSDAPPPASATAAATTAPHARTDDSDNVLNVYNWSNYIGPSIISDFEKESGIKVHYDVYETNEMMEVKLLAGHTNYDIVVPGGSFFERDVKAGVYRKLDKSLLPELKNLDPAAASATAVYDPGNQYGVDYTWLISVGMGYDVNKVKARIADAPFDSWRLIFDPKVISKLTDCGVSVLDSPDDVVGSALAYLVKDPNSESAEDLASGMGAGPQWPSLRSGHQCPGCSAATPIHTSVGRAGAGHAVAESCSVRHEAHSVSGSSRDPDRRSPEEILMISGLQSAGSS